MAASRHTKGTLDAPHTARSRAFTRRVRGVRLLLCVLSTLLLFVSRPTAALVLAPMCGGHGETLTAPPITRNANEVPLAPSDCARKDDPRFETHTPNPPPPHASPLEVVPRLPPVRYGLPPSPRVLVPIESTPSRERAAHTRGVERPPR